jgi:hypothetical protein
MQPFHLVALYPSTLIGNFKEVINIDSAQV